MILLDKLLKAFVDSCSGLFIAYATSLIPKQNTLPLTKPRPVPAPKPPNEKSFPLCIRC